MSSWLKKFEETAFGMLFQDQYLSPSEVVKIAGKMQASDKTQRCGRSANDAESMSTQTDANVPSAPSVHTHDTRLSTPR